MKIVINAMDQIAISVWTVITKKYELKTVSVQRALKNIMLKVKEFVSHVIQPVEPVMVLWILTVKVASKKQARSFNSTNVDA